MRKLHWTNEQLVKLQDKYNNNDEEIIAHVKEWNCFLNNWANEDGEKLKITYENNWNYYLNNFKYYK